MGDRSTESMLAAVPLAVVDASICWWIFSCLIQTTRQLRLRRNIVKLTLYRHFTNTLIFAVLGKLTLSRYLSVSGALWLSCRVLDSRPRGPGVVSLGKTHLSMLSTGFTQEDLSRHN